MLTNETMTLDRFPIPGKYGGTYRRGNVRPMCLPCNTGHRYEPGYLEEQEQHAERSWLHGSVYRKANPLTYKVKSVWPLVGGLWWVLPSGMGMAGKIAVTVLVGMLALAAWVVFGRHGIDRTRTNMAESGTYYRIDSGGSYETDGTDAATNSRICNWVRTSTSPATLDSVIASGSVLAGQHGMVTVSGGEYFVSYGCLPWHKIS